MHGAGPRQLLLLQRPQLHRWLRIRRQLSRVLPCMWGGSASQMRMWFGYGLQGCLYSHDRFWLGNWPVLFSVTFNQVGYTCSSTDSRCTAPVGKVLLESVKVREQIIKQTLIPLSCCLFGKPLFELCLGLHLGLHWLHNRGSRHQPLGGAEL